MEAWGSCSPSSILIIKKLIGKREQGMRSWVIWGRVGLEIGGGEKISALTHS